MSRCFGVWQRAVLDATTRAVDANTGFTAWVSVDEVALRSEGQHLPRSERESVRRAMRTLAARGLVEIGDVIRRPKHGNRFVLAARRPAPLEQCRYEATGPGMCCNARNWRDIHERGKAVAS